MNRVVDGLAFLGLVVGLASLPIYLLVIGTSK